MTGMVEVETSALNNYAKEYLIGETPSGALFRAVTLVDETGDAISADSPLEIGGPLGGGDLNFITAIPVEALRREATDNPLQDKIIFPIVRGDYLVITGSAASGSADCVVEWGEQI